MKKRYISLILVIAVTVLGYLYYKEGTLPANPTDTKTKIFVIEKGSGVNAVVKNLYREGLIRDRIAFYILIKWLGIDNRIQAGDFRLSPAMSAQEIAGMLTKGTLDIWVTVIEGLRKEEIAQIVSKELGIPEIEFLKKAREGYLFPDTYLFPRNVDIDTVLSIFDANFQKKVTPEIRAQIAKRGLTFDQGLTLASLVEREARRAADKKMVASILLKRYQGGWPLQIDATVQYALGYQEKTRTWWKKSLTKADLDIVSPYNTYAHPGIPPAPISSPGLDSIEAVAQADPSVPYYFYISNSSGSKMHYARTIEEHNENIAKYLK